MLHHHGPRQRRGIRRGEGRPPPPGIPANVEASQGTYTDRIHVEWDAVSGATQYKVYRQLEGGVNWLYVRATTTTNSYNDYGASPNYKYDYRIRACIGTYNCSTHSWPVGRGWRGVGEPTNVQATDGTYTNKVRVTWNASANATSYRVYRGTSPHGYNSGPISVGGALYWDEGNITPGVEYYWWVTGYNSGTGDESGFGGPNTGYRSLSAPTGFGATDGVYCSYTRLLWDYVQGATSYQVTRGDSPSSHNVTWNGINTLSWNDYSGTASNTYYYWVRACAAETGCGPSTMYDSGYRGAPPAPAGIMATDGTIADYVNIHWGAVAGGLWYAIYRGTSPSFVSLLDGNVPSSSYDDYSAVPGTVYYYRVKACNFCGLGATGPSDSGSRPEAQPTATATRTLTPAPTTTVSPPLQTATPAQTPSNWTWLPLALR